MVGYISPSHCVCWGTLHVWVFMYLRVSIYLEAISWHRLFPWVRVSPEPRASALETPLLTPSAGLQVHITTLCSAHGLWASELRFSCTCNEYFTPWSSLRVLQLAFINVWNAKLTFLGGGSSENEEDHIDKRICLVDSCFSESVCLSSQRHSKLYLWNSNQISPPSFSFLSF